MIVRSGYLLKKCDTLDKALTHVRQVKRGASKHADADLEIFYNQKVAPTQSLKGKSAMDSLIAISTPPSHGGMGQEEESTGQWEIWVIDKEPPPGGRECAECFGSHFEDDYLCRTCRAAL